MRSTLLLILLSFAIQIAAQIHVLPDLEVTGESQVKIYLYKKALPYTHDSLPGDSISAFLPTSLPSPQVGEITLLKNPVRHYFHAEAKSRMALDAEYRYIGINPQIRSLGAGMSLSSPKGNLISNHFQARGNFLTLSGEDIATFLKYYNSDGKNLNSEYGSAELYAYKDQYKAFGYDVDRVSTGFTVYGIKQKNMSQGLDTWGMDLNHQSTFRFPDVDWGNRILLSTDNSVWQSYIETPVNFLEKASLHIMFDGENFLPVPGFVWRYITDIDQQFSVSNNPIFVRNTYDSLLEKYRWVGLKSKGNKLKHTLIPINISFRLEDFQPTTQESFLRTFMLENRTQLAVQELNPVTSINPELPGIAATDVFSNNSTISASFGQGTIVFDQTLSLNLAYLSDQNWIRAPYQPLLAAESQITYESYPYGGELELNQLFFAVDHMQRDLPEVVDLSLEGRYDFGRYDQIYLRLENILGASIRPYRTLPNQGFSITAGIYHRF